MHRVVAVLIAVSALPYTQVASAADIPAKAPAPVSAPLPAYNWTGFYVGGNVGGAWSTTDWTFFNGATLEPISQPVRAGRLAGRSDTFTNSTHCGWHRSIGLGRSEGDFDFDCRCRPLSTIKDHRPVARHRTFWLRRQ
jgi:opacity protein-like surface antigen